MLKQWMSTHSYKRWYIYESKAVIELEEKFNPDIVFVESGGDNLSVASFLMS